MVKWITLHKLHSIAQLLTNPTRSLYAVARLSVTFVRPTQPVEIFGNVTTLRRNIYAIWYLAIHAEPLCQMEGAKRKRVVKFSDFGPIEDYISETVQVNH